MKDEDFDAVVNVNLHKNFLMTRAFLKKMYKKKRSDYQSLHQWIEYTDTVAIMRAAKASVVGLSQNYAKEGALRNMGLDASPPGMIESDMTVY